MSINRRHFLMSCAFLFGSSVLGLISSANPLAAHEYEVGALKIEHPWLRIPNEGETSAPLFMHIENKSDAPDKLIGVKSDKVGKVVIHADPKFIVVPHGVVIPAHASVMLEPGGPYVELNDVKKMNPVGWGYELTLIFEKAGEVTIDAAVEAPDANHAHDAAAQERWEKAHSNQTTAAPAGQDTHHSMDHQMMDHSSMDHEMNQAAPAPTPQTR
jgi:hypothetical protein